MKISTLLVLALLAWLLLAPAAEQLAPIRQDRESFLSPARGPLFDGRGRYLV